MSISLAIGAPISMLNWLCPLGDIELCFAHLFQGNLSTYAQYYFDASQRGRFIILDNGVMEIGHSVSTKMLIDVASRLNANLVTPPEVLHNGVTTLRLTSEFVKAFERSGLYPRTKLLVAAHGSSFEEWQFSFRELVQIPYVERIGIPYDVQFDVASSPARDINRIKELVSRRVGLCDWITRHFPDVAIHLFGLAHPSELSLQVGHSSIKSIDTSLPFTAAQNSIRFDLEEYGPYKKSILDMALPLDNNLLELASHNIMVLKQWLTKRK